MVELKHLPFELTIEVGKSSVSTLTNHIENLIEEMRSNGLGPRKISKKLKEQGYDLEYYKIAYYLKKKQ